MESALIRDFLQLFPLPVLVIDGALRVLAHSRRVIPVFGLRSGVRLGDPAERLTRMLAEDQELGDSLALATARLLKPGEEERFVWNYRERAHAVTVCALEEGSDSFLVIFEDITSRAVSEEILRNARTYLEQILDDIPLGVIVFNEELRITTINSQQLGFLQRMRIELSLVETIGAKLDELLPDELGQAWQGLCQDVLDGGARVEETRKEYPVADGDLVLAIIAAPLCDQRGQLAGVILVSEDVTEQTRLERELVRVEKLATVGQMVITINHEINNPLSIISTNAQTLRLLNPDLDEKVVAKLHKIEEQVKRIAEVTERLRRMDEVATSEYIDAGPDMIDVWGKKSEE